jgi:hypothetical protein
MSKVSALDARARPPMMSVRRHVFWPGIVERSVGSWR